MIPIAGPLVLLAAAPAIWFGGPLGGFALAPFPLILLARRVAGLPLVIRTTDKLLAACASWACVTALAISSWQAAAPKLFGVLLGLSLVYLLSADPPLVARLRVLWLGLAIGLPCLIAVAALFLTEWPKGKLLPLDGLYTALPAGPRIVDHGGRTGGIGPNQIGGLLALLAPLSLALSLDRAKSRLIVRSVAALLLIFTLLVLLLVQSRSAMVGALAGLTLVGWWWLRKCAWIRSTRARRVALNASAALVIVLVPAAAVLTWLAPIDSTTDTLAGRLHIWSAGLVLIGGHLYTGIGPGHFPLALKAIFPELGASVAPHVPHAHNFTLQALLDLGLPGFALLSAVVGIAVHGIVSTARQASHHWFQLLAVGLLGSLLAYFVYGLTDTIAPGARGNLPFWLVLGLSLSCGRHRSRRPNRA